MKIAVLMACYNGEKYLREQIDSILSQMLDADLELIVRDDGSSDNTVQILESYAKEGKLRCCAGENIGAARTFLSLLRDNPGYDYYAFSDQDDVWYPDKLQRGIDRISGLSGPALYCTNCELVNAELESVGRNTHRKQPTYSLKSILCLASCAQGCTSVFNRALAEIVQDHPVPDTFIMHDSLLTCLCGLIGGAVIYDDEPSMKYRIHGGNVFGMVSARQSVLHVAKDRLREITQKRAVSMYDQAESLLKTYGDCIRPEQQKLCRTVIDAKHSLPARLKLVCSGDLRHDTLNKTVTKKLEILLGND